MDEALCLIEPDSVVWWEAAAAILQEYADSLGVDLSFQGFDAELRALSAHYAVPRARLLLALVDGEVAGCGAFVPRDDVDYANACEMKRLYVRRPFRRFGLGRRLAQRLMSDAFQEGYSTMLLDTLDDMESARELYASLGFVDVPPYYFNPLPGARYLKAELLVAQGCH